MIPELRNKTYRFLRWTEKWTKTDMIYLTKGGFWLTLGKVISSIATLALAVVFANVLPKEVYGIYKYIISIVGILTISTLSGIDTSLAIDISKGNDNLIYPAIKTKIRWGILGAIASILLASYYFLNNNYTLGIGFLISSVFLPFMDSFSIYSSYLLGKKDFRSQAKYLSIIKIIAIGIIMSVVLITKNIFLLVAAYFASYTILRMIFLKLTLKKYKLNNNPKPNTEKGVVSYGKHLSFLNAIGAVIGQIDKILVFHFLGPLQLATYSFAIAIPEQMKGVLKGTDAILLPKFSQKDKLETKKAIERSFFKLLIVILTIIGIYITIAPLLYKILFPQYIDAINLSRIFSFTLIIFVFTPFSVALKTQKKIKAQYLSRLINSLIQLSLMTILIFYWGLIGLVIARAIIKLANGIINACMYYKSLGN